MIFSDEAIYFSDLFLELFSNCFFLKKKIWVSFVQIIYVLHFTSDCSTHNQRNILKFNELFLKIIGFHKIHIKLRGMIFFGSRIQKFKLFSHLVISKSRFKSKKQTFHIKFCSTILVLETKKCY